VGGGNAPTPQEPDLSNTDNFKGSEKCQYATVPLQHLCLTVQHRTRGDVLILGTSFAGVRRTFFDISGAVAARKMLIADI
jgi:hypothetical protein